MNTLQTELSNWEEQKTHRLEAGDKLEVAREIDHFATFKNRNNADAAAAELEAMGFKTSVVKKLFSASLMASREDKLTDASVKDLLAKIIDAIEKHNGSYDGFGAPVAE